MTGLETCFLCNQRVLGLVGQELILEAYYLRPDDDAWFADAYGPCHISCLISSRWGSKWSLYMQRHIQRVDNFTIIHSADDLIAYRTDRLPETRVVQHNGLVFNVQDNDIKHATQVNGGSLIRVAAELSLDFTKSPHVAEPVQRVLAANQVLALQDLLQHLGVWERMLYPIALEKGELRLDKQSLKILRRQSEVTHGWIWGKALYTQFVPEKVMNLINEMQHLP